MGKAVTTIARQAATIAMVAHQARLTSLDALQREEAPSKTVARLEQQGRLPSA